jgi:hypothetical protein
MDNTNRHSPSGVFMALIGLCAFALLIIMLYGFVTSNLDFVKSLFGMQSDDYGYYDMSDYYSDGMYGDDYYMGGGDGMVEDGSYTDGAEANNGGAIDGSVPGDTDGAEANNGGAIDDSVPGDTDGADTEPTAEPDQIDDAAASSKVIAVG